MKLFIKKDTSHPNGQFVIFDECGNEKYYVIRSNHYNFHNLKITDLAFNTLCRISGVPLPVFYAYTLSDGKDSIRLVFNKSTFRPVAYYYGISWGIRGDIINKSYQIADSDNSLLLSHTCNWVNGFDNYEVDIFDESRELLLLASVICIDRIETSDKKELQPV
jgi:uncharacterized protein YxjI